MGLRHRRSRTDWERGAGYAKRGDSPKPAQIFSRALECFGLAVPSAPDFCKVRVIKGQMLHLPNFFK